MRKQIKLYGKLALDGMKKNRQLYLPYLITCMVCVMIFFLLLSLTESAVVSTIYGARTTIALLKLGTWIVGVFSVFFLFYTHSFLIRRRQKEFGLYHILGMSKRHLIGICFWESVMGFLISVAGGMVLGLAFYKLAELILMRLVEGEINYRIDISLSGIPTTIAVFAILSIALFARVAFSILIRNPLKLFKSEQEGEKPPKANWILGVFGVILLGFGYYVAITHRSLMEEDNIRFLVEAIVAVIFGTYFVFIAISVMLCRILQKRKAYYYQSNHFISVSSMAYRMKRNGTGLASICILLTMILVMLSAGVSLMIGTEDMLSTLYPEDFSLILFTDEEIDEASCDKIQQWFADEFTITDEHSFSYITFDAYTKDGAFIFEDDAHDGECTVCVVDLDTYSQLGGDVDTTLSEGEILLSYTGVTLSTTEIDVPYVGTYVVKQEVSMPDQIRAMQSVGYGLVLLIVEDRTPFETFVLETQNTYIFAYYAWRYGFDVAESASEQMAWYENTSLYALLPGLVGEVSWGYIFANQQAERSDYLSLYGGIFFLGGMLSIVFLLATVLMIYYKQISEGYEDAPRFIIMQKIGMTAVDIRKNINSQMRIVFLLPVSLMGIHMAVAFPMIKTVLSFLALENTVLFACCTVGCFALIAMVYGIVYKITSTIYFKLVYRG